LTIAGRSSKRAINDFSARVFFDFGSARYMATFLHFKAKQRWQTLPTRKRIQYKRVSEAVRSNRAVAKDT
jgi:hypothetical protein